MRIYTFESFEILCLLKRKNNTCYFVNTTAIVVSLSKHQLSATLKGKCLDLNEKFPGLDHANGHPKMGCRKLSEHCSVGKTAISSILKDSKNLGRDYEFFKLRGRREPIFTFFNGFRLLAFLPPPPPPFNGLNQENVGKNWKEI